MKKFLRQVLSWAISLLRAALAVATFGISELFRVDAVWGAAAVTLLAGVVIWYSKLFGIPLHDFADFGQALGAPALIFSGLAAYAAFRNLRDDREARKDAQLSSQLEAFLDAKAKAIDLMRWRRGVNAPPQSLPHTSLFLLQDIANELQREFASEDLSAKVRVNPEYSWHPKWGRGDTGASEFIVGTGPYSQIVYQTLTCLTLMSPSNRGAAALTASIRFSDEEITLIFYAGATLAGRWADIRSLVETTHFFSYHPKILDLILPEGVIAQLMEHWGWSPDAWLPSRKKTP